MTFEQNVQINCQLSFQFSTRSWSWQLLIFLEEERFKLWCNSFHLQSRAQNLFAKAPGHTNRIKKLVNCSAIVFMYFRNVFIRPEGRRLPWTRMAFKRQITFPKAWKPLVNYSRSSALVSCLKNDNCFGCCVPRQKSELHRSTLFLSLSHLKKNTNRWQALQRKDAPRWSTVSLNNAGWQTDTSGLQQVTSSGESPNYNKYVPHRTFLVTFECTLVHFSHALCYIHSALDMHYVWPCLGNKGADNSRERATDSSALKTGDPPSVTFGLLVCNSWYILVLCERIFRKEGAHKICGR